MIDNLNRKCLSVCFSFLTHGHNFDRICTKFGPWHPYTLQMTMGLASAALARGLALSAPANSELSGSWRRRCENLALVLHTLKCSLNFTAGRSYPVTLDGRVLHELHSVPVCWRKSVASSLGTFYWLHGSVIYQFAGRLSVMTAR